MDAVLHTGSRIRSYRSEKGLRQAELARICEISPSYLNLIEHNRRRIGGVLLLRIAAALEIDPSRLSEGAELAVAMALESASDAFPDAEAERAKAAEFANRFPGWARLIAALYRNKASLEETVARLDKRLTHDPYLAAQMHNILTSVTSIRSSAGILANSDDVGPEWEARFQRNIFEDSQKLTETTEGLVRFLENETDATLPLPTAEEEVDAWLTSRTWRFGEIEANPDTDISRIVEAAADLTQPSAKERAFSLLETYAADVRTVPESRLRAALADGEDQTPLKLAEHLTAALPVVFRRLTTVDERSLRSIGPVGLIGCSESGEVIYRKPLQRGDFDGQRDARVYRPLFQALDRPMVPIVHEFPGVEASGKVFHGIAVGDISYPAGYSRAPQLTAWMLLFNGQASQSDQ